MGNVMRLATEHIDHNADHRDSPPSAAQIKCESVKQVENFSLDNNFCCFRSDFWELLCAIVLCSFFIQICFFFPKLSLLVGFSHFTLRSFPIWLYPSIYQTV